MRAISQSSLPDKMFNSHSEHQVHICLACFKITFCNAVRMLSGYNPIQSNRVISQAAKMTWLSWIKTIPTIISGTAYKSGI